MIVGNYTNKYYITMYTFNIYFIYKFAIPDKNLQSKFFMGYKFIYNIYVKSVHINIIFACILSDYHILT